MTDWFEDETLWEEFYPFVFHPGVFDRADREVEALLELTGLSGRETGTPVLDLACGPGRHAVPLARRGCRVTGVDLSKFLLEKARRRGEEAAVEVEWVRADMREFRREGAFDLVVNYYTSFGYFADPADQIRVLENVHRSLRGGGILLLDTYGKEILARDYEPTASRTADDGSLLVERHEVVDGWTRVAHEWIVVRDGEATSHRFEHTVYSGQELRDLLRRAGFSGVELYGDLGGSPYGPEADRLVVMARR